MLCEIDDDESSDNHSAVSIFNLERAIPTRRIQKIIRIYAHSLDKENGGYTQF